MKKIFVSIFCISLTMLSFMPKAYADNFAMINDIMNSFYSEQIEGVPTFKNALDKFMQVNITSSRDDFLQIIDKKNISDDYQKCLRDMFIFNAKATGFIFPYKYGNEKACINKENIDKTNKSFYVIPINLPSEASNYSEWKKTFDVNIKEFKKELESIVK